MTETEKNTVAALTIKRVYRASVDRVYRAWTDPAEVTKWLAPNERFVKTRAELGDSVGSPHNLYITHSDGDVFPALGEYVQIEPNKLISFTWKMTGDPSGEGETLVTVAFRAVPEGTELTLTHENFTVSTARENTDKGWTGCLESLEKYLDEGWELPDAA
jgi:uncharacterized protein YndB with AHSA1/START domain